MGGNGLEANDRNVTALRLAERCVSKCPVDALRAQGGEDDTLIVEGITADFVPRTSNSAIAATGRRSCGGPTILCGELCGLPLDVPGREPRRTFTRPDYRSEERDRSGLQLFAGTEGSEYYMDQ